MFKELRISNFKGIDELWLDFGQLNVLIGANSAGKSTIFQAIDLLINSVNRDVPEYLSDRGWKVDEIKSQITKSRTLSFLSRITIDTEKGSRDLLWSISFLITQKDNSIVLHEESIEILPKETIGQSLSTILDSSRFSYLSVSEITFQDGKIRVIENGKIVEENKLSMNLSSSILKILKIPSVFEIKAYIDGLIAFMQSSLSLEALSIDKMRHSSRGFTADIGRRGERLAAFINQFGNEQRSEFVKNLQEFLPAVKSLDTITKGKPGWIELFLNELYDSVTLKIKSSHISDGSLRIIALVSLLEMDKSGMIILDEIEDGINPHIASLIVKLLNDYSKDSKRQLVVTTHSSLMLDDFEPGSINYVFRRKNGSIGSSKVFERSEIKPMLDYMNPGEIWINTSEQELLGTDKED